MAVIFYQLGLIILGFFLTIFLFLIARKTKLRWWPAFLTRLLLLLVMLFVVFSPRGELIPSKIPDQEVMIIDNSWSIDPDALIQIKELAGDWIKNAKGRTVIFASTKKNTVFDPKVECPDQDKSTTNLVSSLLEAEKLLNHSAGKIILVSDGYIEENLPVMNLISDLKNKGHEIYVMRLNSRDIRQDRTLAELISPKHQWEGTPFEIQVPVFNTSDEDLKSLMIRINGENINVIARKINPNLLGIRIPEQPEGILNFQVFLNLPDDPNQENNSSYGIVQIYPAPTMLMVSKNTEQAKKFLLNYPNQNNNVGTISPEEFPLDLNVLQDYQVIMLHNLMASDLSFEMMKALKIFVSELGGGLVFLGGNNSYTLGDYKNTILEPILPVKLEPPPRNKKSPMAYLLILDRSGSMADIPDYSNKLTLLDLAREAAMRSLETIGPEDYLGVITYESDVVWDVPLELVGEGIQLRRAMDIVSSITHAGKTSMYLALTTGFQGINELPTDAPDSKNILILTDGQSSDGSDQEFVELAQKAKAEGITISTIGLGRKVDKYVLCSLAEITGGRCYMVVTELDLPNIMVAESEAIRSENIQYGDTTLLPVEGLHPVLSGMKLEQLPLLNAYNALTSKADQGAEDVLKSANFGDPILSVWQYGLGRVAAWMSDVGEVWTQPWINPEEESIFWSQVVRYTLVNPAIGPVQVEVGAKDDNLEIFTRIEDAGGSPVNLAKVEFQMMEKEGSTKSIAIPQIAPGKYKLDLQGFVSGNYVAEISFQEKNGKTSKIDLPFSVNYFNNDFHIDPTSGERNIDTWIESGAHEIFSLLELTTNPTSAREQNVSDSDSKWLYVLLGLVIFWPLEIALRRQWLPWIS
ncbi:MAG: VWA domain-containing protein [Anaerolineaceae bacterium]|nr:VWA domain-containing protein [Anaerolineaceae bacterium]